ncbi:hypothetical protein HPB49_007439 [Dermacentor silvarum]|uniref:Uncharacterized protein n=1 Tax=Dermacentor silvarum TaxID=543639 RepID=A0ACB8DXW2_DERSI|nr:hypothetical protein HPB49_007439 [Dermacentor silvarum]
MTDDVSDDSSDLDAGVPAHTIKYFPRSGRQKGPSNLALKRANLMFTMENERYRTKCRKLERFMKDLVIESAALCDQVARVQESIFVAKEERRFLLKKFLQYRQQRDGPVETVRPAPVSAPAQAGSSTPPTTPTLGGVSDSTDKAQAKASKKVLKRRNTKEGLTEEAPRPKRRKPAGADKRLVAPIPLDSCGRPLFPIVLPGCKVHSLGEIVTDRAGFHCQESLWVRFEVSRSATDETERLDSDPYLSYAAFRQLCLQPRLAAIAAASEPSLPGGVTIKQEPLDTV